MKPGRIKTIMKWTLALALALVVVAVLGLGVLYWYTRPSQEALIFEDLMFAVMEGNADRV